MKARLYLSLLVLVAFAGVVLAQAPMTKSATPIVISQIASQIKDNLLVFSAQADIELPEFLVTAINTGSKLTVVADIEILRQRDFLPDKRILDVEWHRRLHLYALTRKYVVEDLALDTQANLNSLAEALQFVGAYNDMVISEAALLNTSQATHVRVRVKVLRAELPLLLRLKSYLLYPRPLSSDWYQWSL